MASLLKRSTSRIAVVTASLFVVLGLYTETLFADLPPEARTLVQSYEKAIAETRTRLSSELQDWRNAIIAELKGVQRQLATEDLLDEAVQVRNVIRGFEAEKGSPFTKELSSDEFNKLPKEAQKVLLNRESPGSVETRLEIELAKPREVLVAKLAEMQKSFAAADKLDEAVSIRDWIRIHGNTKNSSSTSQPEAALVIPDITAGANDLNAIRANYQAAMARLVQALQSEFMRLSDQLVQELQTMKAQYTKSGQLDEALAIRKVVDYLRAEKVGGPRIAIARAQKGTLPEDAQRVIDACLVEADTTEAKFSQVIRSVEAQLAKPLEKVAEAALLGTDLEAARNAVSELYGLKRQIFPYRHAGRAKTPLKLAPPAVDILDELDGELATIRAKLQEREAPLRQNLLDQLRKVEEGNLKAETELAVRRTIDFLSAENLQGLRGLVLFCFDPELRGEAAELVMQYLRETTKLIEDARAEYTAKLDAARPRLDAARKVQVDERDWEAAYSLMEWMNRPARMFPAVTVKYGHTVGDKFPWDGTVIDMRDGVLLVINVHQSEEWMTRDRIRVGAEDFPGTRVGNLDNGAPPPGFPVTEKTKLTRGGIVLFPEHHRWTPVEVKDIRSEGIVIHYFGRSDTWDKSVDRSQLRTMVVP